MSSDGRGRKKVEYADKIVGQQIRSQRNAASMSQSVLADALGVTFQQVQKYEKGVNRVSATRLVKIAALFQVPVTDLLAPEAATTASANRSPPAENPMLLLGNTRQGIRLARAFNLITINSVREAVVTITETLSREHDV